MVDLCYAESIRSSRLIKRGLNMAKAKKTKRRSRNIVRGHLERIKSELVESYRQQITELVGRNHGVYALYKDDELKINPEFQRLFRKIVCDAP